MVHVFAQLNLKQGLKRFGSKRMKVTKSEIHKIYDKVVFHPIKGKQITKKKKHEALRVIMFLKQKRCGKIKGRAVADRLNQIEISKKSDVTSPMAATESVLITAEIDVTKGWDVAVIDAPGAFLTADMDE